MARPAAPARYHSGVSGRERVLGTGLSFVVAYLLMFGGTSEGMVTPEIRIVSLGIATLAFGGWVAVAWHNPEWRPRSALLPVMVAALVVMGVSAALSRSPRVGAESVAQAVILGGGYLLLVEILRRPSLRSRVLFVASAVGIIISIGYLAEVLSEWDLFWTLAGPASTPPLRPDYASLFYGNPSPMLAMAVLLGAVLVGSVPSSRRGAAVAAVGALVALIAALLTGTRAGWLGVVGGLTVVVLLAVSRPSSRRALKAAAHAVLRSPFLSTTVGISLLAGVAAGIALVPGLLRRLESGGEEVRSSFYAASIRMFESSPLMGVGAGMWPFERASRTTAQEADFAVAAAHNLYLQTVAEMGTPAIVVGIAGALTIGWMIRDGLRDESPIRRRWALIASFSAVYFAVHSLLDFLVNTPSTLLAVAVPLAVLDASAIRLPWRLPLALTRTRRAWFPVAAAILGAAIGFAWWTTPATTLAAASARLGNLGEWVMADQLARQAREVDPARPEYQLLEGLTAAHNGDDARALADLSAFAEFSDTPEAWIDVAALKIRAGDLAGARKTLANASRLGLQHPALAVAISDLALRAGDSATALAAASAAVAVTPSLIADPWWSGTEARATAYADLRVRSLELASPDARWEIELMSGGLQDSTSAAQSASDPSPAQELIKAWGGETQAADGVFARCNADPLNGPTGWCARVAAHIGDLTLALRYARLGVLVHLDPDTTGELSVYSELLCRSSAGGISSKAGGSWRQPVLWDILVPGVLRVANPVTQNVSPGDC